MTAPVRIVRDRAGVPHIYAENQGDLFFAQGFVQAQDRLFQIDLWRRSAQGRLSEVLGPNFVERDAMTRRMQYRGDAAAEWASYGPDTEAIATAFVRGVNAWVLLARERPPEEFALAGFLPEAWAPADLLNRTDAFVASGDAVDEVFRARLVAAVGARELDALLPGEQRTAVPRGLDVAAISPVVAEAIRRVGTPPFFVGLAAPVAPAAGRGAETQPATRDTPVAGETAITFEAPSRRYLVHLNAPGWNVIGATSPWLPGVAVGHNGRLGWDTTRVNADTQDVFVERLNPANAHQVEDRGAWVDTERVRDTIGILRNPKPFAFETEFTRHGVIVASDRERNLAYAVRWSGSAPGAAAELGALALDRAASTPEFLAALSRWKMPPTRFSYAGADGTRGSHVAALVPTRRGWDGALPAPAWLAENDWEGWRTAVMPAEPETRGRPNASAAATLAQWARAHHDRADSLIAKLSATPQPAIAARRRLIADALADARSESVGRLVVTFAHPLGITANAKRRFNVGPVTLTREPSPPVTVSPNISDWDRTRGMNAPGQSGSPASAHFNDLAALWSAGESIQLPFSDGAVQANAASTLTLVPRNDQRR